MNKIHKLLAIGPLVVLLALPASLLFSQDKGSEGWKKVDSETAGAEKPKLEAAQAKPAEPDKSGASAEKTYSLKTKRSVGSSDLVEVLLEVIGEVKLLSPEQKIISDKMEVVAGFRYEERVDEISADPAKPLRSIRQYELARAKMNVGEKKKNPELEDSLKTMICSIKDGETALFSPDGKLKSEQLLLTEGLPGNTLIVDRLLPEKDLKVGDSWKVADKTLAAFLYIDEIKTNNTKAVLTAVADDIALVEIVGEVEGTYLGAGTEMSVQAKYQFDLKSGRIVWIGVLNDEKRAIGHAAPGVAVRARLQVKILPLAAPKNLKDDVLKNIDKTVRESAMQLQYEYLARPWTFLHNRNWFITLDEVKTTILRVVAKGELLAQCQLQDMGRVPLKSVPSLGKFTQDLEKGLEKAEPAMLSEEEINHPAGYKTYRVTLEGMVDDIHLHWIYYLLTDNKGNQRIAVFVLETDKLKAFGESDRKFIDDFRIMVNAD